MSAERAGVPTWKVNRAVRASDLDPQATVIMLVLSDIADNATAELPPQRTPSTRQLARETRLSETTVKRRRRELEAAGWIVLTRPTAEESRRHVRIRYRLAIPAAGAHRAHAEAAEDLVRGLSEDGDPTDPRGLADPTRGFTVNPPEGTLWTPGGVWETPPGGPTDPGVGSVGPPNGGLGDPPKEDVPDGQELKKPSAAAGAAGREQRLTEAEELTDAFWDRWGSGSAQRRPAVRAVIITAVADNAVPRNVVAHALDALARVGQQITPDSLTKALARMRTAEDNQDTPPAPPPAPKPPRRFCQVYNHAHVELTAAGICRNCAGDAKAAAVDDDLDDPPPARVPLPRHALSPDDTQMITRTR